MFKLASEQDLLIAFRPKDRGSVEIPKDMVLPRIVRDYLAWTHPSGGKVFLVFSVPGGVPTGIAFEVNGGAGATVTQMCDWCHSNVVGSGVGLLTATLNERKRVGIHVCADLSCKDKLEDAANLGGYSPIPAIKRVVERMGQFASQTLRIDLSGANR